jgi:hypothetical protein
MLGNQGSAARHHNASSGKKQGVRYSIVRRLLAFLGLYSGVFAVLTGCSLMVADDLAVAEQGEAAGSAGARSSHPADDSGGTAGSAGAESDHQAQESGGAGGSAGAEPKARVSVLLVVDSSGSMEDTPEGYAVNRWEALTGALGSALAELPADVWLGLELFPTTATPGDPIPPQCGDGDRCCEMPSGDGLNVDLGPAAETAPMVTVALESNSPAGGTPATAALQRAYDYFNTGEGQALGGDRFVVLVLDGVPNCNPDHPCVEDCGPCNLDMEGPLDLCCGGPEACPDAAAAAEVVESLRQSGVRTVVVGVPGYEYPLIAGIPGSEYLTELLDELGGHPNPDGPHAHYAPSAMGGVGELEEAIEAALASVIR